MIVAIRRFEVLVDEDANEVSVNGVINRGSSAYAIRHAIAGAVPIQTWDAAKIRLSDVR